MQILNVHDFPDGPPSSNGVYVGRGSAMSCPFASGEHGDRAAVLASYRAYLTDLVERRDPVVLTFLAGLRETDALLCDCTPALCHGEVLREAWHGLQAVGGVERGPSWHEDGSLPATGEVFVFGSSRSGRHGAGVAMIAAERFGAREGVGEGYMARPDNLGHCYAIPTFDEHLRPLSLEAIRESVGRFARFVRERQDLRFLVTRIGCGQTGYDNADIGGMFRGCRTSRVSLPAVWRPYATVRELAYAGIGARKTPSEVLALMTRVATRLEQRGFTLRSGGAHGADSAFAAGCTRKEVFLPWKGFNRVESEHADVSDEALRLASVVHPNWDGLNGAARRLMARNGYQILGRTLRSPADFVVCWTPDSAEHESQRTSGTGGTGQAIALAARWKIPVFNLANPDTLNRLGDYLKGEAQSDTASNQAGQHRFSAANA